MRLKDWFAARIAAALVKVATFAEQPPNSGDEGGSGDPLQPDLTGIHDDGGMPAGAPPIPPAILMLACRLKPADAIKYLEQKGYHITWSWKEMDGAAHAKAFTVAKCMKLDILEDIRAATQQALDEGQTFRTFQKNLEPTLKAKGWWGKVPVDQVPGAEGSGLGTANGEAQLGSPWRLETIYKTNLQTSYMVGRYKGQSAAVGDRPYLQYIAIMDAITRPTHAAMNGRVFRFDDPVWDSWSPPNGFNCRCRTRSLSHADLERYGLSSRVESTNGEVMGQDGEPMKPDEGWDYNPGKEGLQQLEELAAQKQADLEAKIDMPITD